MTKIKIVIYGEPLNFFWQTVLNDYIITIKKVAKVVPVSKSHKLTFLEFKTK